MQGANARAKAEEKARLSARVETWWLAAGCTYVSLNGQGDEAYIDSDDAIHVRKANVRFYISFGFASGDDSTTTSDEEQLSQAVLSGL